MGDCFSIPSQDIKALYGALRSELNNLSVQDIRNTAAAAGIDVTRIPAKSESRSGIGSRAEVMPALDNLFGELDNERQIVAICIIAERLIDANFTLAQGVQSILGRHGYQFLNGVFVPVKYFDQRENYFLPHNSSSEISRAYSRLLDGNYSGAITSACGAVDILMQKLYEIHDFGDPGQCSYQAKVNTALKNLNIIENMKKEFEEIGISEDDSSIIVQEIREAINHAAQSLQILRRTMGDVHGTKPALRNAAYDSIKWASSICGLFNDSE
jgi:hypothetical protein